MTYPHTPATVYAASVQRQLTRLGCLAPVQRAEQALVRQGWTTGLSAGATALCIVKARQGDSR